MIPPFYFAIWAIHILNSDDTTNKLELSHELELFGHYSFQATLFEVKET